MKRLHWAAACAVFLQCLAALSQAALSQPALAQPTRALPRADRIHVEKAERTLTLYRKDQALKTYKISLGTAPVGPKEKEGDGKTPEGRYTIDYRNARSQFHRALHISYPSAADKAQARALGVSPGGDVMIHGLGKVFAWMGALHAAKDWTLGCIAVTNEEIEEIWRTVPDGTPIEIVP